MDVAEIIKIVVSFAFVTALTILAERYISDKAAVIVLLVSTVALGYLYREDLGRAANWGREHRPLAISLCIVVFAIIGLGIGLWITKVAPKEDTKSTASTTQNDKPPTLLDLFKSDFGNTLRVSDTNGPAFDVQAPDGSKVAVLRQLYMDFPARTKFIGFYLYRPVPPPLDFKAERTAEACLQLLKANTIQGSFKGMEKQVGVMGGQIGQMTTADNLTFSGRVLIYHEEFLSIPQKAAIMAAYQEQNMDVQFYGDEYLGLQVTAWYQKHDKTIKQP